MHAAAALQVNCTFVGIVGEDHFQAGFHKRFAACAIDGDTSSITEVDTADLLYKFTDWVRESIGNTDLPSADAFHLLTHYDLGAQTSGLAWTATMCTVTNATGLTEGYLTEITSIAQTLAHELGSFRCLQFIDETFIYLRFSNVC